MSNWMRTFFALAFLAVPNGTLAQDASKFPECYLVDYPQTARFCPPIRSTFFEVTRTFGVVRGKRFRQKPNGGYGLPVADKVDGKNLLHVGADLGWYQINEPVFAIANGVVRLSIGPDFSAESPPRRPRGLAAAALPWGNLVVIEHRLPDGRNFTTIYGHLAAKRLVQNGDVVAAGQPIGAIGRQHARINGGYKPHLHFGVREGRIAEVGADVIRLFVNGKMVWLKLKSVGAEWSEVELPKGVVTPIRLTMGDLAFTIESRDGKPMVQSEMLWRVQRADFPLVGYALETKGFRDPIKFLREQRADSAPAAFRAR